MALFSDIGAPERREGAAHDRGSPRRNSIEGLSDGSTSSSVRATWYTLGGKRALDFILASLALIVLAPVLLALAIAVKLSGPGPVIFRQMRHGRNGVPFAVYKFRTMHVVSGDPQGLKQVQRGDAGVTRIGRMMRATSLDELPQLLNIVRGEMSIIGPRPHPIGMLAGGVPYDVLVPNYHERHAVRPGLSGWAQVNGLRGPTVDPDLARARIEHDVAYIHNQSVLTDLMIIFLTIKREFLTGSGV